MPVLKAYRDNYDRIAAEHVASLRAGKGNPWQGANNIISNEDETYALIEAHLPKGSTVLEVGCGVGDMLLRLRSDYVACGFDLAEEYVLYCQSRGLNVWQGLAERTNLPSHSFDAVVCADVLEHVLDEKRVLREIFRVLRPGGLLFVRVPVNEDLEWYMTFETYEYIHLRSFSEGGLWLLFKKVFGCEIVHLSENGQVAQAVVRK